ncbi:1-aminocyclopropane-1-carboxylate deaminase [Luteitalea sp. TBR-22]|uniref:1-aminocyclopropane-1-carboxylate deaminase/D-cysteine desulfhydrase n=1 Tax=Luteitalea sp. TBR-22 TaxID=2802971 RepID=UPI001AFC3664|nr:pyridoxal-phosphate dependent enzyme [Luteitalea sp. TBR-22]BCS33415.1 1-aminocyclopropane-1-carboxylate deaminase [Luteitalea sp. TBR-22]
MTVHVERLRAALAPLPRVSLGTWPTPLVRLERLGAALGVELWMKRDECSGLAMGGNKARKLEFVLGSARAAGARSVVTAGPVTSNHTMMTAAAARRLGLDCHVVLGGRAPDTPTGNLALTHLFGAHVHVTPMDTADPSRGDLAAAQQLSARLVAETGGCWIPPGATMPSSVPGYASAILELLDQLDGEWPFDEVVVAYGTGSTSAGLYAGLALAGIRATVRAVAVSSRAAMARFDAASPNDLVQAAIDVYRWPIELAASPARCEWIRPEREPGYGLPTGASQDALRRLAREEGYLLDPTYTAKAAAEMFAMARDGRLRRGSRVLFIHTGGLPTTAAATHQESPS